MVAEPARDMHDLRTAACILQALRWPRYPGGRAAGMLSRPSHHSKDRVTARRACIATAALWLLSSAPSAMAEPLRAVRVTGVDGDERTNIEGLLSLNRVPEADRANLSEARLSYLLRVAPDEVRAAVEPYGYYSADAKTDVQRSPQGIDVNVQVTLGEPVTVRESNVVVNGAGGDDGQVRNVVRAFAPRVGQRFDHRLYEGSKLAVQRRLLERGYFDAELRAHRVEVSRQLREASIKLDWDSGQRYRFGETTFSGSQIRNSLLEQAVPYEPGKYYHQRDLLKLHQRLTDFDYFGYIDVSPDVENAEGDRVPVRVSVTPGKRSVYTAGVSVGTDSGAGVQLGLERRWVNDRGHKLGANLDVAQRRKSLGVEYRIPAFAWAEGWYAFGANRRDEESDVAKSRITELVGSRTGTIHGWQLGVALHARTEDFTLGLDRPEAERVHGESRLVYPALSAQRVVADDALYPTRGFSLRGEVKTGASALGSETTFAQFLVEAKLIRSFGERNRLLVRGQVGRTQTDEFGELPPSLRFFAGGDRSIRGYGYQEVGPREDGIATGGKNLLVGSVEYERMFSDTWGAAVFVDGGNAFNDANEGAYVGTGVGVRWRSPVGLVRFDIARGLKDPEDAFQIHINIGPDL